MRRHRLLFVLPSLAALGLFASGPARIKLGNLHRIAQ